MQVRHNITLDEEISGELDDISSELGWKKSHIIQKALVVFFDYLDLKLAEKRMKQLEEGEEVLVDADEVWKELGI